MGGLFGPQLLRASWPELLEWKREHGITWVASSPSASLAYDLADYPAPTVIWVGDERKGLSETALGACDFTVCIPMAGRADSLNVAVSAGLLLYEVFRKVRS
jgi:TrmH family RNA methyltransferase